MINKEQELLELLNSFFKMFPIELNDFNNKLFNFDQSKLLKFEESNTKLGLTTSKNNDTLNYGISTLSMIATITDCLTDKRLKFIIDDETNIIIGVSF